MALELETKINHHIPIADTGKGWKQTCEIPVVHTELKTRSITITYLRFTMFPGKLSGLDILAGGQDLEIAGRRISAQMIQRLEITRDVLQKPNPPLNASLEFQQISQYFISHTKRPNAQLVR